MTIEEVLEQVPGLLCLIREVCKRNNQYWNERLIELLKACVDTCPSGHPSQAAVREVLEKKKITLVSVGNDPVTKLNGLFKGKRSALTSALSCESSLAIVQCASGLDDEAARKLLESTTDKPLDVLKSKPPPGGALVDDMRNDSKAMMQELIQIVLDKDDHTVIAILSGWLPDLLLQLKFDPTKMHHTARARQDGSNSLKDAGILHSDGGSGQSVHSRMLPSSCAATCLEPPRVSHSPHPRLVCRARQSRARPSCSCGSARTASRRAR